MVNKQINEDIYNLKQRLFDSIADVRFDNRETEYASLARIKQVAELMGILDELELNFDDYDSLLKIFVSKDTVICPGKTVELKTNVSGYLVDETYDIILEGFVPNLLFSRVFPDESIDDEMYICAKSLSTKSNLEDSNFKDPFLLENESTGIYKIKSGTIIGFAIKRKPVKEKMLTNTK